MNKERARRLIRLGLMTEAGIRALPDLSAKFEIASDIVAAIQSNHDAWQYFQELPDLYVRVRVGYIEEARRQPVEFSRQLKHFIAKTGARKMFGIGTMLNDCCEQVRPSFFQSSKIPPRSRWPRFSSQGDAA